MNYTPEQLREAANHVPEDREWFADQLRAHADALEELARLKAPVEVAAVVMQARNDGRDAEAECILSLADKLAAAMEEADREREYKDDAMRSMVVHADRAERAEAELVKLRGHAEEMYEDCRIVYADLSDAAEAYRADFPKEGT